MNWFRKRHQPPQNVTASILYDETTFYNRFIKDLLEAKEEVIIESPFMTVLRLKKLKPIFDIIIKRGVEVFIVTRYPKEHDKNMAAHAEAGITYFERLGAQVLLCEGHHRKLSMIDRKILWEGSLNILSQTHSREFMRRMESKKLTEEMFSFLKYNQVKLFKKRLDLV